ncbi:hypothetical protein DFJ77DRAFT_195039 [Powellomyces hirtus]|nr:hypothetical protein DFJ77DRAFT_195039 [Powellomyces hirtus]
MILAHFECDDDRDKKWFPAKQDWISKYGSIFQPAHRALVVDWMAEIAEGQVIDTSTYHLAICYFDIFMSLTYNWHDHKVDDLQNIGAFMLNVACKAEQILYLDLKAALNHEVLGVGCPEERERIFQGLFVKGRKYEANFLKHCDPFAPLLPCAFH